MVQTDLMRGRAIETVFEQGARLFIGQELRTFDFNEIIPIDLAKIYFIILPNHPMLKEITPIIQKTNGMNYQLDSLILFTLKDIIKISDGIPEIRHLGLYHALYRFNSKNPNKFKLEGNLAAIIYILFRKHPPCVNQSFLSQLFGITEVTLRSRIKEYEQNPKH